MRGWRRCEWPPGAASLSPARTGDENDGGEPLRRDEKAQAIAASTALLLSFIAGATLFAAIWSRFFRRGPLEHLLNSATKPANRVR